MGKRGPKSEPTASKRRRGNPGHQVLNDSEPEPEKGLPPVPKWLRPKARKHWRQIGPMLKSYGVMTVADGVALALLADALIDYIEAREIVEAAASEGSVKFITKTDKGNIVQHPAVGVMNKAWQRVLSMLREFGMTPSARAGLHVGGKASTDPLAKLIAEMNQRRNAPQPN